MIKRLLLALVLVFLYVVAFAAGSFAHPFGVTQTLGSQGPPVRLFIWDGALLMVGLYVLTLVLEAIGRRLRDLAVWTTASLVVAAVIGYLLRFGFVTKEF